MLVEKLQFRQPGFELPCFRCHGMAAECKVTMNIGRHGAKLIVCLCDGCTQLPETELYAHFARGKKEAWS